MNIIFSAEAPVYGKGVVDGLNEFEKQYLKIEMFWIVHPEE